jgi:hypothetical protein
MNRKALAVLCTTALAVGGMFLATASNPTKAAVAPQFSGYATGTDVHADLLKNLSPGQALLSAKLAFSGAAVDGGGLKPINDETSYAVVPSDLETAAGKPKIDSFNTYGQGSGLTLCPGCTVPNNPNLAPLILSGLAEQAADPPTPAGTNSPGWPSQAVLNDKIAVPGDPLVYASLLRGAAIAGSGATACQPVATDNTTGTSDITKDLGFGLGWTAKAQLVDQGKANADGSMGAPTVSLEAPPGTPPPGVTQDVAGEAKSFTFLTPNGDGTFGLTSETIESIAPVSLNLGGSILTIEIGGPWVLTATANGKTATPVHVGPLNQNSPTTLLVTLTPPGMPTQTILKTQDLFGGGKIPQHIDIPGGVGPQLASINIGEDPRPIGSDNTYPPPAVTPATPTSASAALDVVRVKLLAGLQTPGDHVAELRIGHAEASSTVPSGGITCPTATTTTTAPGGTTTTAPGATTTTTAPGGTTTTTAPGATTSTTPSTTPGNTTSTSSPPFGPTTTVPVEPGGPTTTAPSAKPAAATTTSTVPPAQVQAVTFSQSPAATPQSTTPNFTG